MSSRIYGVVCGVSGNGKSYLLANYIIPKLSEKKPVIVLDIHGEYSGDQEFSGFQDFMKTVRDEKAIPGGVNVIAWKSETDAINTISFIRHVEKNVALVIEEAHVLFTDSSLKKAVKKPLKEITMFGRHYGIDTILCSQRPANLTTDVRSQAQFMVFFKLIDRADLEYARQIDPNAPDTIESLQKTEFFTTGVVPNDFAELKVNEVNSL